MRDRRPRARRKRPHQFKVLSEARLVGNSRPEQLETATVDAPRVETRLAIEADLAVRGVERPSPETRTGPRPPELSTGRRQN